LAPEKLEHLDFYISKEVDVLQLVDGHWIDIPSGTTTSSPTTTARIYDAMSLPPNYVDPGSRLELLDETQKHYWHLPTVIGVF